MKRFFLTVCVLMSALLMGGCHEEIEQRIKNLKDDISYIEEKVNALNQDIVTLSELVSALEKNEHITSIRPFEMGNVSGYQIVFTSGTVLTLRNGTDGVSPIVGVRYNESYDAYYWTIQMGPDGTPTWMTNSYGLRVRATGTVPQLKIEDGVWWYSYDGTSWSKSNWGAPQGQSGSSVFSSVDTSDPYYVTFVLANGTRIQMPTQQAVDELNQQCNSLNETMQTYTKIIQDTDASVFVKSVAEFEEGGVSGLRLTMESGQVLTIRNGYDNRDSVLLSAKAWTDGKLYWVYRSRSDEAYDWLRYQGKMICVTLENITPYIGIVDSLGQLYFTVAVGTGAAELMRDADGNPVKATGRIVDDFFTAADLSDPASVVLTLADGTQFTLPRTRLHVPSVSLSLRSDYVEADTEYSYQALMFLTDTLTHAGSPVTTFAAYCDSAAIHFESIAIDDGYTLPVKAINITSKEVKGGYEYSLILDIPFVTGPASSWYTNLKSRIAVFITWQNNTIMKVIEFRRAILATELTIPATAEVEVGKTTTLTASWLPANTTETNVTWSSSDTSIATISDKGVITGVAEGVCTVTARLNRVTATCAVTVKPAAP